MINYDERIKNYVRKHGKRRLEWGRLVPIEWISWTLTMLHTWSLYWTSVHIRNTRCTAHFHSRIGSGHHAQCRKSAGNQTCKESLSCTDHGQHAVRPCRNHIYSILLVVQGSFRPHLYYWNFQLAPFDPHRHLSMDHLFRYETLQYIFYKLIGFLGFWGFGV